MGINIKKIMGEQPFPFTATQIDDLMNQYKSDNINLLIPRCFPGGKLKLLLFYQSLQSSNGKDALRVPSGHKNGKGQRNA